MTTERAGAAPLGDPATRPATALLAIGCSAGSLTALIELVSALPAELAAAVLVCQHTSEHGRSNLPRILARRGPLPADWAEDGARLEAGRIHVAPPGRHLMVHDHHARLSTGPRVNRHRPSVDVLFASVAQTAGSAATVVVLSGVLDDGAVGSALVDRAGGQVLVQDPDAAEFPGMPRATLAAAPNARVLPGGSISGPVVDAVRHAIRRTAPGRAVEEEREVGMAAENVNEDRSFLQAGESHVIRVGCPDCGGGLAQVDLPQISYFRCHVGHQYGPQSLVAALAETSESRLWSAVAALEEEAMLQDYLEPFPTGPTDEPARPRGISRRSRDLWSRANELREQAQALTGSDPSSGGGVGGQSSTDQPS